MNSNDPCLTYLGLMDVRESYKINSHKTRTPLKQKPWNKVNFFSTHPRIPTATVDGRCDFFLAYCTRDSCRYVGTLWRSYRFRRWPYKNGLIEEFNVIFCPFQLSIQHNLTERNPTTATVSSKYFKWSDRTCDVALQVSTVVNMIGTMKEYNYYRRRIVLLILSTITQLWYLNSLIFVNVCTNKQII